MARSNFWGGGNNIVPPSWMLILPESWTSQKLIFLAFEDVERDQCTSAFPSKNARNAGRPSKALSKERLEGLLRLKIPVSRIAKDLQVSRCTVYKAMAKYDLQETRYSNISEADIQHAVSPIKG